MFKSIIQQVSARAFHLAFTNLSPENRKKVGTLLLNANGSIIWNKVLNAYYLHRPIDAYLVSFPKCGRTWLRLMIGRVLESHFELSHPDILNYTLRLEPLCNLHPAVPRIHVTHDDNPHWKKPEELVETKNEYRKTNVILLVRDPRDVVVSAFFEQKKRAVHWIDGSPPASLSKTTNDFNDRLKPYEGNLVAFLYEEIGSLRTLIRFYKIWSQNIRVPKGFLLIRYEDIHTNPEKELRRALDFLGVQSVKDEIIAEAVQFASFSRMRKMEIEDQAGVFILRPADAQDEDSYKTRKGKVGGFVEYFSESEIDYMNRLIEAELPSIYGYSP
jgi:hypothetical protein